MNRSQWLAMAGGLTVCTLAFFAWQSWPDSKPQETVGTPDVSAADDLTWVRLSAEKAKAAKIVTQPVTRQTLTSTRSVPARFGYDETRHIAVRSPVDGVIESVEVYPGDTVTAGTVVAVVRSPAVGSARSMLFQRDAELELARTQRDWSATIDDGVRQLVKSIQSRKSISEIREQLSGSVLGEFRADLMTKYNSLLLAEQLQSSVDEIRQSGAISGKMAREREARQTEASAALLSALEQATYQSNLERRNREKDYRVAQQTVHVARQTLANLTGEPVADDKALKEIGDRTGDESPLSLLEIRSPIAGTTQRRAFAATERVQAGEELFIIADTSELWVNADLRERDLVSVRPASGDSVAIFTTDSDQPVTGTVRFMGREMDPKSGTVPLTLEIDNSQSLFRPGMYARAELPVATVPNALVVADSAIIEIDGQSCVFVQQPEGFRPVNVKLGIRSSEQVQVLAGLSPGDGVVTGGVFILKSELLLEGEE